MSIFATAERDARLPVLVLTGFLGSGKTTLLNRLLQTPALADTAVVINEIGDVGLDQYFLDNVDSDVVMLANGCICCRAMDDLEETISTMYARRTSGTLPAFKRLVIETTGLADPGPVLEAFLANPILSRCFRVGGVVTTVDVLHGEKHLNEYFESVRQVAVSDRLVLTKVDLADRAIAANVTSLLRSINLAADIAEAGVALFDPNTLFSSDKAHFDRACKPIPMATVKGSKSIRNALSHGRYEEYDRRIGTFTLVIEEPVAWQSFSEWLRQLRVRNGEKLLRIKGVLNIKGEESPIAIHGVHHVLHPPTALNVWPWEDRRSRLVFVTSDLAKSEVEDGLRHALREEAPCLENVTR